MTVGDLIRPDTPVALALAGVLLVAAAWIGKRAFASQARQGRRVGALEQAVRSERLRRRQVEQCLREQGFDLPYWPDDPAELHGITARRRYPVQDDAADDSHGEDAAAGPGTAHLQTQYFIPPRPAPRRTP